MELKVDLPSLAEQNVDPAAFQRVWDRVMPGQASPEAQSAAPSQTAVPDTAVPAEPSVSPEQALSDQEARRRPSVPACPQDTAPALPSVPDCPAQPPQTSCQVLPAVPDCPNCPACPGTPPRSAEPQQAAPSPLAASAPPQPALCLGETSQGDSGRLEQLMTLARTGAAAAQMLARRSGGSCARALSALACDHRLAFRRLSAAYFLITGKRYAPNCSKPVLPSSLPLGLRQQFAWEQSWEQHNRQAAQNTADPCLKELYLELAQEGAFHAGAIRSLLEQM